MLRSKTVFVLGAGASAEVGLPIGAGLLSDIAGRLDIRFDVVRQVSGDFLIENALRQAVAREEFSDFVQSAWRVVDAAKQARSIDYIVDAAEDSKLELVAKIGIARSIQFAEKKSEFFAVPQDRPDAFYPERFRDTWYNRLVVAMCEGVRRTNFERAFENLAFISFNYDRCIENYLPRAVANYFGVPIQDVLEEFKKVPFHRPYGVAGEVRWGQAGGVEGFGRDAGPADLLESARRIRTFTEQNLDQQDLNQTRKTLKESSKIVLLGTAFHDQNLEVMSFDSRDGYRVFATAYGVSSPDLEVARKSICRTFRIAPHVEARLVTTPALKCKDLFDEYGRALAD